MTAFLRGILHGQYEAALCMLGEAISGCPDEHWDGVIGKYPFWQVAYHTLCYADLYLTPNEKDFVPRTIHPAGWKEFDDEYPSRRFTRDELTAYVAICREKAADTFAGQTQQSLEGPSGFARRTFSRGELHIYNIRHIQHHTGQLGAFLRRIDPANQELSVLRWLGSGWR